MHLSRGVGIGAVHVATAVSRFAVVAAGGRRDESVGVAADRDHITTHVSRLRLLGLATMLTCAVGGNARLFLTPLAAMSRAQGPPSPRAAVRIDGAWTLTETAFRSPGGPWEARPAPQGGLFVFSGRHYSYFYIPGPDRRARFAHPNQPTDAERAAAYGSFIAGAGSYTFDGSTLALKADFRKNPNEMNGDFWRLEAQLHGDRLQLVFVNPPFRPGSEYRMVLVRVE